ncbi:MAG: DUF1525 domain-containing protein [Acidiferrobacterales bacterium]|nr:DUF1525 domain-containing protein [Acidiferrobacterales bacterium]
MKAAPGLLAFLFASTINVHILYASDLPQNIKLFIDKPQEIRLHASDIPGSISIELYDYSLINRMNASLSENLSDNPQVAARQAADRIKNNLDELKNLYRTAIEAHELAERFGILRLPAAVIDDSIVVYDTTELDEILRLWRDFRNQ